MILFLQVWTTWLLVALSTRKTVATSPSGVACWRLARTPPATRQLWRTPTFWPVMHPFASLSALFQLLSQRFCPMVTTIWTDAWRWLRPFWPLATRHWATTTCTWRELCWNQTCAPLEWATRELSQLLIKSHGPPSPLCAELFQALFRVRRFSFLHNCRVSWSFAYIYQELLSCLVASLRRKPPSTWTPSTCSHRDHGPWPSRTVVPCKPPCCAPGAERRRTSKPLRMSSSSVLG